MFRTLTSALLLAGLFVGAAPLRAREAAARVRLPDLEGHKVEPLAEPDAKAAVFIFVRTDCPISNRYAPEMRRLYEKFAPRGIAFWLVYVDPSEPAGSIRKHIAEYKYQARALRDPEHALVRLAGARVTPEAAVFLLTDPARPMVYRGRIDDWYVDFGKQRPAPTTHDLERALETVAAGKPFKSRTTQAVGCFISDLR